MWKIKHTEVIDVIPEEETKSVRVITRGKLLYVVSQDAEDQKWVWHETLRTQVYWVLYYCQRRQGFTEIEFNWGLTINPHSILIVKDKGILFAEWVVKELALPSNTEAELVRSDDHYEDKFKLL